MDTRVNLLVDKDIKVVFVEVEKDGSRIFVIHIKGDIQRTDETSVKTNVKLYKGIIDVKDNIETGNYKMSKENVQLYFNEDSMENVGNPKEPNSENCGEDVFFMDKINGIDLV